jgi:hypothetical protein
MFEITAAQISAFLAPERSTGSRAIFQARR